MDANKIWNKIVSEYELYKNYKEEEVQTLWEGYFSNLFEYDRQADFLVQVPIHIGSTDKKADIILKTNNTCLCVIELKQYSYAKEIDYEKQLLSYMTHVDIHCSHGILICNQIYLYKYNFLTNKYINYVIPYIRDSKEGIEFVKLFLKENYNPEQIDNFIITKNKETNRISDIKKSINRNLIITLLKEHFSNKCSEEEFDKMLSDFQIEVYEKTHQDVVLSDCNINNSKKSKQKDTTQYSYDGINYYGKCRFPFEVVKSYVDKHPDITFSEIKTVFPDGTTQCGVNLFIENIDHVSQQDIDGQRYSGLDNPIRLNSGESIVVSNQYNPGRIAYFNKVAQKLGYTIQSRK